MSNLLGQKETHSCICSPCSFSSALCMCKAQLRIHTAAVCGAFSSQPLFEAWMLPEDHTLTWNRPKAAAQGFISFSVSEILIINCCFPIISSFRTASGYKGGWADGRKRSTDPQAFQSYQGWAPESHCSRMGAVHLAALHTSGFLLWTWGLTSASAFLSLLPGLRTAASVIALMLSSSKGKWSLSVLRNSFTAQVGSL